MSDEIPRRARMEQWTPAERAIYDALLAVEAMPADLRLTDAVVLLGAARDSVADFVDGVERRQLETLIGSAPQEQDAAKLERMLEISRRAYDRLALCPDHRDKATGRCIVCVAEERTKREVAAVDSLRGPQPEQTEDEQSREQDDQRGAQWYARAVKARNALSDAIKMLRGGHDTRMDGCDLALAELDIVLGLAPYRTGTARLDPPVAAVDPLRGPQP